MHYHATQNKNQSKSDFYALKTLNGINTFIKFCDIRYIVLQAI